MGELQERFRRQMVLRGLAQCTIEKYEYVMGQLVKAHGRAPDKLSNEEIQKHIQFLLEKRRLTWGTVNNYFSAYRFFYVNVLGWNDAQFNLPRRGRTKTLPLVLDGQTALKVINTPIRIKHRALLYMVYGSGLRVSEVVRLKPSHIESAPERMMVRVEQAKGRKDRYTILSKKALEVLREHWKICRPKKWLFFGWDKSKPMARSSAQHAYKQACRKAGITHGKGIHTLRHCFASHLIEAGVPLWYSYRCERAVTLTVAGGWVRKTL
ncbi:tyrosine-type recombinase/integrase [Planctomycetota bacterium]